MSINIIMTVLLLVYGCFNLVFENKLASPFLALVFIFIIWKLYKLKLETDASNKKLDEIKEILKNNLNENDKDESDK